MSEQEQIRRLAKEYLADTVAIRRHLHAHPELSFEEFETSAYIKETLKQWGIPFKDGFVKTGIVALIEGKNPSKKTVALRADIDALPIREENKVPYVSANEGVMHACGHDVHTSSVLASARILLALKDEFEGTVKLIFQPGEEKLPGGASLMIKEGALENPRPDAMFGQHVQPDIPAGKVGFRPGQYMASADELFITVKGKGGHGAMPNLNVDPVLIGAHLIVALQQLVSRQAPPAIPTVLSIGKVIADGATNVIPDEVKMEGTFRTMNETWRTEAHQKMVQLGESLAASMGGSCDFRVEKGYPCLMNHERLTQRAMAWAQKFLGKDNVIHLPLRMTSEDFSFYSQVADTCFYRMGTGNVEKGITSQIHTSTFDIDESALETSSGLMAWLALQELATED
ncbi:MAG: amidohydrolase [Flavobacteriales bacterium]|nr:amidohydrolase [Flavobacteriales bacterium]MCB9449107.1 amidohydrolase [Flavobacteriales bacterium]